MRNSERWGHLMKSCKIKGFGYAKANRKVTNDELSTYVDTNHEWIESRTGICSRYVSEEENTSDLGTRAAIMALENSGVDRSEVDLIICATFTPDYTTPSAACLIQEKLGMNEQRVMAFDINAACSGFLYALEVGHSLIATGQSKCALILGAEVISKQLNWNDRGTCIIFADGAGAAVLREEDTDCRMLHFASSMGDKEGVIHSSAPLPRPLFSEQPYDPSYVHMEGNATFRFAVKAMQESMEDVMQQAGVTMDDIDWVVPHQANKRIITNVCKRMDIDMEKVYININEYGNTSAASIPLALGEMSEKGLLKEGMKIVLSGFGAGFTWAGAYIEL
ncbi:beta-ketoacyl-ACP synthase III [Amedibacillus sp. YH-ame10]